MGAVLIILGVISLAIAIASIVFWIMTLIKLFKNDQIVLGIIGIICPIVAFVMGWVKANEYDHKQIMIYWTICVVAGIVLNVISTILQASA